MAAPEQPLPLSRGCPSSTSLSPPRGDRTLLVRHLPAELTAEEKEDLLKYFGAQSVRVLSDKGRLVRARASLVSGKALDSDPGRGRGAHTEGRRQSGGAMRLCGGSFPIFPLLYQNLLRAKCDCHWLESGLVTPLRKRARGSDKAEWKTA